MEVNRMKDFRRLNALIGGAVAFIAFLIYLRTLAPTTSFWDCGEFIACSYILGIPHPPGAPLYLLVGRVFTMIPFAADIGYRVNLISALTSAFTVLFAYLIIVRMVQLWRGSPKSNADKLLLCASGAIGALAFAFTDSHWFNAVEAEVYAISLFFTAAVVWLIMVWHEKAEKPSSDRYLLMIAYCVGLAMAVHLLNILALPFVFLIFYFKKFKVTSFRELFVHGVIAAALLAFCVLLGNLFGAVVVGILLYLLGHIAYYRSRIKETVRRYCQVAILLGAGVSIFAAIYPGVIKGIPYIADKWSLEALGAVVVVLIIAMVFSVVEKERWLSLSLMSLFLIVLGYSTYATIFIRSGMDPAIDENDPETTERMVSYLNREQYGTWGTLPRRFPDLPIEALFEQQYPGQNYKTHEFSTQLKFFFEYQLNKMYWRYFGWQFIGKGTTIGADRYIVEILSLRGLLGLPFLLGLFGMVHHFFRDWRRALPIGVLFIMTGIAIVVYLNQEDPQPRERDYVYTGSYFAFALWIGIGVAAVLEWLSDAVKGNADKRRWVMLAASVLLFILVPLNLFAFNFESHDRTGNYVAYDYSYNLLQTCEKDAIVFTNGDNDTFPLWFLQEVYGIRKDVRVVNLSLLNTAWYIKQLRDQEPRVPIRMTDDEIDRLRPMPWQKTKVAIDVSPQARERDLLDLGERQQLMDIEAVDKVSFEVAPTLMGQGIRVQDWMILRILHDNQWRRPVYFAVTVSNQNKINMFDYLRMDGMNFKIVTIAGDNQISPERLHENLFDIFRYRNLDDPDVYYNDNIKGLLQNYRAAFLRLAAHYAEASDMDNLLAVLEKVEEVIPEEVIPVPDYRASLHISDLYRRAGKKEVFEQRVLKIIENHQDYGDAYRSLLYFYQTENRFGEAADLLQNWVNNHPDDQQALELIEDFRARALEVAPDSTVRKDSLSANSDIKD